MKRLPYITHKHTIPRTSASWCKALPSLAHFICESREKMKDFYEEKMHI
jgi:hypothetical protein